MSDPPAAVVDTHALIFHAAGRQKLGRHAKAHLDATERREALTYVPAVVAWECSLLVRVGRIDLGRSLRSFFDDLLSNPAFHLYDLTIEQVHLADEGRPNADPFDALICAAARSLALPLITRDETIRQSKLVTVVW